MDISREIVHMISEAMLAPASIGETSNLYTDLGLDSLAFVYLLLRIEEAFSIKFGLMEMGTCTQVGRLIALVENKVKEAAHDSALIDGSGEPE